MELKRRRKKKRKDDKYFMQRYSLFSLFDMGIELDEESWFSVTPEQIALHHALRCGGPDIVLVDACCGVGGNAIAFAKNCKKVIAVDIDQNKLNMGRQNAKIYNVDNIEWVCGDFNELVKENYFRGENVFGVFISPPWGGPSYNTLSVMTLADMPVDGAVFFRSGKKLSKNVAMFLPRNIDTKSIKDLSGGEIVEIETNYLNDKCKSVTCYWGDFVDIK